MKSQASDKKDYVAIQVRTRDGGVHIQGKGVSINRPYGVAVQAADNTDGQIPAYLDSIDSDRKSLAGTDAWYVAAQAAIRGDKVHIQVANDVEFKSTPGSGGILRSQTRAQYSNCKLSIRSYTVSLLSADSIPSGTGGSVTGKVVGIFSILTVYTATRTPHLLPMNKPLTPKTDFDRLLELPTSSSSDRLCWQYGETRFRAGFSILGVANLATSCAYPLCQSLVWASVTRRDG